MLLTDLVDSTGRRVRSGEEAADQLRQHHDRLLRVSILATPEWSPSTPETASWLPSPAPPTPSVPLSPSSRPSIPTTATAAVLNHFRYASACPDEATLSSVLELPETTDWFEQALAEHVVLDGPAWIARTHLNWAEHLSVTGDDVGARQHGELALDTIGERDYRVTAQRARSILNA